MLTRRTPISVAEAQKKINEIPLKTTTETIPLSEANHRILAEDVHAHYDYPHFRRAGMDGYAILASDDHDFPASLMSEERFKLEQLGINHYSQGMQFG